jgi:glucose/arabinose dehydrogenase
VDAGDPYSIPLTNPFANAAAARPEIYAYGFRNPWRFSFDPVSGGATRLFLGDVGQNLMEEVDLVTIGGNYGWNIKEGTLCFSALTPNNPPATCSDVGADGSALQPPIMTYLHTDAQGQSFGTAVIGGFLYRGNAVPNLRGGYVFGDYADSTGGGRIFVGSEATSGAWSFKEVQIAGTADGRLGRAVLAFGRDAAGELYVLTNITGGPFGTTGAIHKIIGFD